MTQAAPIEKPRPARYITFEEFLDYGEEGKRHEWVNGEVFLMPSPSYYHQDLAVFLAAILRTYVRAKGLGTILPGFTMHLPQRPSGRDPDILFVSASEFHRIKKNYLDGGADLLIEIVSPSTEGIDRDAKFKEYEQAGIKEYWIIDTIRRRADFYQLNAQGFYEVVPSDNNGIYFSIVIDGLWLKTEWLWQPLPLEINIYKEWSLI